VTGSRFRKSVRQLELQQLDREGLEHYVDSPGKTALCQNSGAESGADHGSEALLNELVGAWSRLTIAQKDALVVMARAFV
jgi:hypothetical protein